jgi:hypothetical protein
MSHIERKIREKEIVKNKILLAARTSVQNKIKKKTQPWSK